MLVNNWLVGCNSMLPIVMRNMVNGMDVMWFTASNSSLHVMFIWRRLTIGLLKVAIIT